LRAPEVFPAIAPRRLPARIAAPVGNVRVCVREPAYSVVEEYMFRGRAREIRKDERRVYSSLPVGGAYRVETVVLGLGTLMCLRNVSLVGAGVAVT
jgi:hypothetical protein